MKRLICSVILSFIAISNLQSQELYIKTFGNKENKALIFLHGGPGFNSSIFEQTTAQPLAEKGFFVIVYDRRGEGRSEFLNAKFTFKESINDIQFIYEKFNIKKASLLAHSFGGFVATYFAEKNPEKVESIYLMGSLISMQETLKSILNKSRKLFTDRNDSTSLMKLKEVENLDHASLNYSSNCFMVAMKNGFYSSKTTSNEAIYIYRTFSSDTILKKWAFKLTSKPVEGFWKNEHYTSIDISKNIQHLIVKKVKVYAMYGKDDGLFSEQQIQDLEFLIGKENVKYIDNCSHNIFIDQQFFFLNFISSTNK